MKNNSDWLLTFYFSFLYQWCLDVMLTFYNAMFTALPIIFYGVFERDMRSETLLKYPHLYREQRDANLLSVRVTIEWMLLGLWHSLVAYFGVYFVFEPSVAVSSDGQMGGLWEMGSFIYNAVILIVMFKLALHSHTISAPIHFGLWASIAYYLGFLVIYCAIPAPLLTGWSMYYIYQVTLATASFWLTQLLLVVVALLPDYCLLAYRRHSDPKQWMIVQEQERLTSKGASGDDRRAGTGAEPLLANEVAPAASASVSSPAKYGTV